MATFTEYMREAMKHAQYERTEEGDWYAHIPGFEGLWATGPTVEDARNDLHSALDGWLYVNAYQGTRDFPKVGDLDLLRPPRKLE